MIRLFEENDLLAPISVLLETEWVLRGVSGLDRETVSFALRRLGGLSSLTFEAPEAVAEALDLFEAGMDFGDALHLAQTRHMEAFVTLDRRLASLARRLDAAPVRLL